nr:SH3 domain-containing protein C23A1.17-like [Aedes albopictus]
MGIKRIRLKILLFLVPFVVAIVSGTTHHRPRHARPIPEVIISKAADLDQRDEIGRECSKSYCPENNSRMKRQDTDDAKPAPADDTAGAANGTSGSDAAVAAATSDKDAGNAPLPPPVQVFPNMPKDFPYPSLDVVQHPPVPTRPRRPIRIQSPYPAGNIPSASADSSSSLEFSNQDPISPKDLTPVEPPVEESVSASDSVSLPELGESPEVLDLSEFNVPGSNDPVVLPPAEKVGASSGDVSTVAKTQTPHVEAPHITNPLPSAPEVTNVAPPRQHTRVMGPQDWRFSEQPQRRCQSKQTCRLGNAPPMGGPQMAGPQMAGPQMAGPPMGGPPMGQPAMAQPPMAKPPTGCRALPGQTMAPAAPTAAIGEDPWKVAEQQAFVEIKNRDDPPATEDKPADSAGERSGLAFAALMLANGLYLLL